MSAKLYNGDCLSVMQGIEDNSIHLILVDLPFEMTHNKWDKIINFDDLWKQYKRIIVDDGAIVIFCNQPFSSKLIVSNMDMYRYSWFWKKNRPTNFINTHCQPSRIVEEIAVFSKYQAAPIATNKMRYNPQGLKLYDKMTKRGGGSKSWCRIGNSNFQKYTNYPTNWLEFPKDDAKKIHPTQKPIDLLKYLIKTYTNEGDTVLDNCMGSGSTGVASIITNRNFIGIELDEKYFDKAKEWIEETSATWI